MVSQELTLIAAYPPPMAVLTRGDGAYVWDVDGRRYVDMIAGVAVTSLGHAHPRIATAIADQASTLLAVSNYFETELVQRAAQRLNELNGGGGQIFFGNSGAEANECALKLARRHGGKERPVVLTARRSFHGRTFATLAATAQEDKQRPFEPLPDTYRHFTFGDVDDVRRHLEVGDVAAVLIEPVQAEGGVYTAGHDFWRDLRDLCDDFDVLLMVDEVQTGLARTGSWFAYQGLDIAPDVVTMAKALGNGLPIGACWARTKVSSLFSPGMHGSTIGGQPLAMRVVNEVLDVMVEEDAPVRAAAAGRLIRDLLDGHHAVHEIRGDGLLLGVELNEVSAAEVQRSAANHGVLVTAVTSSTVRLTPSLLITPAQVREGVAALMAAIDAATS